MYFVKKIIHSIVLFSILAAGAGMTGCVSTPRVEGKEEVFSETQEDASVTVHYFDMGQGNASLVESGGEYMLIDTGNYKDVNKLKALLEAEGVTKLNYMVATHPHADHIGSLATIIREYEIDHLLMPDVAVDTKTYQVAVDAAGKKNLAMIHPEVGSTYPLGEVTFQVLAPGGSSYEEINDYSIALRLTCGTADFLWTGDAESLSEQEMLESGLTLEAEVYHAGHHGSYSSSTVEFLKAVDPEYVVISCGQDNEYGYPHEEVLERLQEMGSRVFVTALEGHLQVDCQGNELVWTSESEMTNQR